MRGSTSHSMTASFGETADVSGNELDIGAIILRNLGDKYQGTKSNYSLCKTWRNDSGCLNSPKKKRSQVERCRQMANTYLSQVLKIYIYYKYGCFNDVVSPLTLCCSHY